MEKSCKEMTHTVSLWREGRATEVKRQVSDSSRHAESTPEQKQPENTDSEKSQRLGGKCQVSHCKLEVWAQFTLIFHECDF